MANSLSAAQRPQFAYQIGQNSFVCWRLRLIARRNDAPAMELDGARAMKLIVVILCTLLLVPMALAQAAYEIQPGDQLEINVLEDPSLNRTSLVLPDGRISLPLAGPIRVAGLTIEQAQTEIVRGLAANFNTRPNVFVTLAALAPEEPAPVPIVTAPAEPETVDIFVLGEVNNPGQISVAPGTTMLQVMAVVGGPSQFAATRRIQLRRVNPLTGVEHMSTFNYEQVLRGGQTPRLGALVDGDIIVVPERRLFE